MAFYRFFLLSPSFFSFLGLFSALQWEAVKISCSVTREPCLLFWAGQQGCFCACLCVKVNMCACVQHVCSVCVRVCRLIIQPLLVFICCCAQIGPMNRTWVSVPYTPRRVLASQEMLGERWADFMEKDTAFCASCVTPAVSLNLT